MGRFPGDLLRATSPLPAATSVQKAALLSGLAPETARQLTATRGCKDQEACLIAFPTETTFLGTHNIQEKPS